MSQPRRLTTAGHDVRLGLRLARRSLRVDVFAWISTGVGIVVAIVALMLAGCLPLIIGSYAQVEGRRMAVYDDSVRAGQEKTGIEQLDGRTYTRVAVSGISSSSARPPGVAAWPEPGASVVSPALHRLLATDPGIADRLALGRIDDRPLDAAGLTSPDELRSYTVRQAAPQAPGIVGYGRPSVRDVETPASMGLFEVASLVVLPAVVLLAISLRSLARRRLSRYTYLVVLGVSPTRCARVFAIEVVAASSLAVVLGLATFWFGQSILGPTGLLGMAWWPDVLAPSPGSVAVAIVASGLTMVVLYRCAVWSMRLGLARPVRRQFRTSRLWVRRLLAVGTGVLAVGVCGALTYLIVLALRARPGVMSPAGSSHYTNTILVTAAVAAAGLVLLGVAARRLLAVGTDQRIAVLPRTGITMALSRWPSTGRLTLAVAGLILMGSLANTFVVWVGAVVDTATGDLRQVSVDLQDVPPAQRAAAMTLTDTYAVSLVTPPTPGRPPTAVLAVRCAQLQAPECSQRGRAAPDVMREPPRFVLADGSSHVLPVTSLLPDAALEQEPYQAVIDIDSAPWLLRAQRAELVVWTGLSADAQGEAIAAVHHVLPAATVQTSDDQGALQLAQEQQLILRTGVSAGMVLILTALLIVALDIAEESRRANNQLIALGLRSATLRRIEQISLAVPLCVAGLLAAAVGAICSWGLLSLFGGQYITAAPVVAALAPLAAALLLVLAVTAVRPAARFDRQLMSA